MRRHLYGQKGEVLSVMRLCRILALCGGSTSWIFDNWVSQLIIAGIQLSCQEALKLDH